MKIIYIIYICQDNLKFFKTSMPESRKADFYLGCLDGAVFIDFNLSEANLISLCRISFDGYGCCTLKQIRYLSSELSNQFIREVAKENLDQIELTQIVKEIVRINQDQLWSEALYNYGFINRRP